MEALLVLAGLGSAVSVMGLTVWWLGSGRRPAPLPMPLRRAADVRDGEQVRVAGLLQGPSVLQAPLRKQSCLLWRVVVQEQTGEPGRRQWRTVVDVTHAPEPFTLRDGDTKVLVQVDGRVQATILDEGEYAYPSPTSQPVELERFLAGLSQPLTGRIRYREGILVPGLAICVGGLARWEADPSADANYREQPMQLVLRSPQGGELRISDASR